jgi:hypothetical protein
MKSFKLYAISFLLVLIVACSGNKKEAPAKDDLLTEEQLTQVIYDIHIVDGMLTANVLTDNKYVNDTNMYYSVFEKNHTTRAQFDATIDFYVRNDMEELNNIYDIVLERLNRVKGELQAQ